MLRDRDNPLFFRADGGLDLSQLILLGIVAWVMVCFTMAGLGVLRVTTAAWAFLGSFTTLAFIAWAARDRAAMIANSRAPGDVAAGIAKAAAEPNLWRDNETGDDDPTRDYRKRTRG